MSAQEKEGSISAQGMRIAVVVSRWNELITRPLLQGAHDALRRCGADESAIEVIHVPGSYEIPIAVQALARSGRFQAIVALGCIIRGATSHYDLIASAVTSGISRVMLDTGIPVGFGVLTTENIEQAMERAGSKAGNKGAEAALTAVEMASLLAGLKDGG